MKKNEKWREICKRGLSEAPHFSDLELVLKKYPAISTTSRNAQFLIVDFGWNN